MSLYTKIIDLQKLGMAWEHVKKNKPAAGVDNITYEMFDSGKKEALKQLNLELVQHEYETLPVRRVTIYKGEKSREIALYAMRDKVVQQTLAQELNHLYEPEFSTAAYAYRNNRSALDALQYLEDEIRKGVYETVLKTDIRHFFDTINWRYLEMILRNNIKEEDVLKLIRMNSMTRILEDTGEILDKTKGIHQGSGIAPVLSNIYLIGFDNWMLEQKVVYIRYSDDILVLGESREQLIGIFGKMRTKLAALGLTLHEEKTFIGELKDGIEFLGHAFNETGKSVPQKAKDDLQERLELMWLTSQLGFQDKVKKAAAIIGGWEQYFREERPIESIFEFTALISVSGNRVEYRNELAGKRKNVVNIYRDITQYLAEQWKSFGMTQMELYEYEHFYGIEENEKEVSEIPALSDIGTILNEYRTYIIQETEDKAADLMQAYTDARCYQKAAKWVEKIEQIRENSKMENRVPVVADDRKDQIIYQEDSARKILKLFAGREDIYSMESLGQGGKRMSEQQCLPLSESVILEHLQGKHTIGTYIQRSNSTVKYLVVDVDVSKSVMLQYERQSKEFKAYLEQAKTTALTIMKLYRSFGMEGYLEFSGCRGFHVWLFFTEWIPTRYANMFLEIVEKRIETSEQITLEFFPNKTRIRQGKFGQCIKVPFGRHIRTGEMSYFFDSNGNKVEELNPFLDGIARYQLDAIRKVLAVNTGFTEEKKQILELNEEELGEVSSGIKAVLKKCSLMRYLCGKVLKTGYLTHFERQSLLYVFGHMGDEGKEFVHTLMEKTLNYQYQVTEKFISKMPAKPISCVKLREQYKSITAEYGCSCSFKHTKNCYPSPVLHAISLSSEMESQVTLPTSKTMTKEKEQIVLEEMNIHKKAENLAAKILEMKKQKRKIDSAIIKTENELSKLYDAHGIDCLEIEMGLLTRRKKEGGYEWLIEI